MIGIGLRVKHSAEAVAMYQRAFGLELGYHVLNDDGSFFHSELLKDGAEMLSVVESDNAAVGWNPVQLGFGVGDEAELRAALDVLKVGGHIDMDVCELPWSPCAAEVTDRFGVNWYLTVPQHRPPESFTPPAKG